MSTRCLQDVPCLFSSDDLRRRLGELARQISSDYQGKDLIVIGVLKGAFVVLADLVRLLTVPVRCEFVKLSSYGQGTVSSGKIVMQLDLALDVAGQELLIVEDIVDTGLTTAWLIEHLAARKPAGIRLCALLDKESRRQVQVPIAYCGFSIPDHFVVGYGIDYADRYRQLPYVGYLPAGEENHGPHSKS